jgi:hypothetical protein
MNRLFLSLGLAAALLCASGSSGAQTPNPQQEAAALFTKGRALLAAGSLDEACAALAQSQALINAGATLLNLADCHSRQGKTASAWQEFGQAIVLAQEAQFSRAIEVAKQRHAELEAKLSFLTIVVPPETRKLGGFALTLNGYPVPQDAWDQRVPVDPGPFAIAAKADGYQPFSTTLRVDPDGDKREVTVTLVRVPPPPPVAAPPSPVAPPPPPPPRASASGSSRKTLGFVSLGVGGAGLLVGAVTGGLALSLHGTLAAGCPGARCPSSLVPTLDSYNRDGLVSTIGFVAGAAFAGLGIVLVATAPKGGGPRVGVVVSATSGGGALGAAGSF